MKVVTIPCRFLTDWQPARAEWEALKPSKWGKLPFEQAEALYGLCSKIDAAPVTRRRRGGMVTVSLDDTEVRFLAPEALRRATHHEEVLKHGQLPVGQRSRVHADWMACRKVLSQLA